MTEEFISKQLGDRSGYAILSSKDLSRWIVYLALVLVGLTRLCEASPPSFMIWTDPTPSALQPFAGNPEAVADLAGTSMLFYPQARSTAALPYSDGPGTYPNVQYVTGAIVVSASSDQVERVLANYAGYTQLFPKITEANVLANEQHGNYATDPNATIRSIVKYHMSINIPVPLLSFNEDILMQHERTHHSISTLILSSPIQYGSGKFEWFPLKNGKTLVTLTQWGDLDRPKGFLVRTIFNALPEVKSALPDAVEGYVLESLRERFSPDGVAKPVALTEVVPQISLTDTQEAQVVKLLAQGGVVQFNHAPVWLANNAKAEKLWFVTTFYQMPAPLNKTKDAFANPNNFPGIYRQVRSVTSTPLPDGGSQNDIKIGIGLGIISIPMHIFLGYQPEADHNSVRFYTTGGDVEFIHGRFQFKALNDKTTLVGLTAGSHLGDNPPLLLRLGKYLPYTDYLPTVGSAPVIFEKTRLWLQKH